MELVPLTPVEVPGDSPEASEPPLLVSEIGPRQSSKNMPSHNTRWTDEENQRLLEAVQIYGLKSWKSVSEYLKTRTVLQVRNRVRHLQDSGYVFQIGGQQEAPMPTYYQPPPPPPPWLLGLQPTVIEHPFNLLEPYKKPTIIPTTKNESFGDGNASEPQGENGSTSKSYSSSLSAPKKASTSETRRLAREGRESRRARAEEESPVPKRSLKAPGLPDEDDGPPPTEPRFPYDPDKIHPMEETGCSEFFQLGKDGSFKNPKLAGKTPERYMLMRNHMVKMWEANKAEGKYLTRSAVRPGLKGDVHAISRVHAFLERMGIINIGLCTDRRKIPTPSQPTSDKNDEDDAAEVERDEGRRITHAADGSIEEEVDQSELRKEEVEMKKMMAKNAKYFADAELEKVDPALLKKKRKQESRQSYFYGGEDDDTALDPFRLVSLLSGKEDGAPVPSFEVKVSPVAIMDFHSHMSMTEIIGLLGGTFDSENRLLSVVDIFPCKSSGNSTQCEMDPESEVKAHTYFSERSLSVVGWYHSHPSFDTNPSIRDIETQGNHQDLFHRRDDGIQPFVGAIVSPYDSRKEGNVSTISWMTVASELAGSDKYRKLIF
ncbi:Myb-like, SWIRM and MPN domains 1 [Phlyctochytrium planicorne]|nr:Myb-like, SWIRM and MPN domains 1 [Phlyctochytrium planicorne]